MLTNGNGVVNVADEAVAKFVLEDASRLARVTRASAKSVSGPLANKLKKLADEIEHLLPEIEKAA